jgi:hypothetical protein
MEGRVRGIGNTVNPETLFSHSSGLMIISSLQEL